jgi:hypothetical protein
LIEEMLLRYLWIRSDIFSDQNFPNPPSHDKTSQLISLLSQDFFFLFYLFFESLKTEKVDFDDKDQEEEKEEEEVTYPGQKCKTTFWKVNQTISV